MKTAVPIILDTCAASALAAWLGGLCVCWVALAPAVRAEPAGYPVFVETMRRFGAVVEACGLALAAIQWALRRRYERERSLFVADGIRMLVVFAALFLAEYGRYLLVPALAKTASPAAFGTLQALAVLQALLLVAYAAITSWLLMPRTAAAVLPAGTAAPPPRSAPAPTAPRAGRRRKSARP